MRKSAERYGLTQGSSTVLLYAPNKNGEFEVRLYSQIGVRNDDTLVMSVPFAVSGATGSSWAQEWLEKANALGLIPDILKGADMTKPITREEFCELALVLYISVTGKTPEPASPNPFTDTTNQNVLRAFKIGVTAGTSATTFAPKLTIPREQCAVMLWNTIKAIVPNGDFSTDGAKDFTDQALISWWALDAAKYMAKHSIMVGDTNGNFMPKATTDAQTATNYGLATREAALIMAVKTYDLID